MTLREIRRHRQAIRAFHLAYSAYCEAGPHGDGALRDRVVELAPSAESAMKELGMTPVISAGLGLPTPISGLANLMFRHERPGWASLGIGASIVDTAKLTEARLLEFEKTLRRRRRNPLYWIDRLLRLILAIPAYLLSLLFRTPFEKIDGSAYGHMLRLIGAAGTGFAIYFGGHDAGWW